jgi:hypothetical protein
MARFELIIRTPPAPDPATAFRSAPSAAAAGPAAPTADPFRPAASGVRWGRILAVGLAVLVVAAVVNSMSHSTPAATYPYGNYPTNTGNSQDSSTQAPVAQNANSVSTQVTPALVVTTGLGYSGDSGKGSIEVDLSWPGGPIVNKAVEADIPQTDVQGHIVPGHQVDTEYTDSAGRAQIAASPGQYLVRASLPGSNWGDQPATNGTVVTVAAGATTRIAISCGAINFEATTVDGVLSNREGEVLTEKTNVQGQPVKGDQIDTEYTDNTGAVTFLVTPGSYELASSFTGYNWGNLADADGQSGIVVNPGQQTVVKVALGRLRFAAPANTQICIYKAGSTNGAFDCGYTDNTGQWLENITAGTYSVQIGGQAQACVVTADTTTDCP